MPDVNGFVAGFAYGATSVFVGQPLDTIKTKVQMNSATSSWRVGADLFRTEGIAGLYRGGLSLLMGGALIRSAQFGVNDAVLQLLRDGSPSRPRVWGVLDLQIVAAGFCGGIARGLVETPFEYIKVRRQLSSDWKWTQTFQGGGATMLRNSVLFSSFVIYMDISKLYVNLSPFWLGSICANLAWLTIWPMDVVKTQLQSGDGTVKGKSIPQMLLHVIKTRALFRGLVPGLLRSTISNGCAMVAYKKVQAALTTSQ